MRMSVADGLEAAYKNVQDNLRFYPLSTVGSSPELELVSLSGQSFDTVHANDFHFYEELNAVVQREPADFFRAKPEVSGPRLVLRKANPLSRMRECGPFWKTRLLSEMRQRFRLSDTHARFPFLQGCKP